MSYHALTIGLSDNLFAELKSRLSQYDLHFIASTTVKEASRLLNEQIFHLLVADLEFLRNIQQIEWLSSVRHISFAPVVILTDTPEEDMSHMIELGMDICVSDKESHSVIADLIHALFRRYTEYDHYKDPLHAEVAAFHIGDIFIDPPRHEVVVRGQPVNLRPREFSLLLYLMQNPNIVLSSEKICEQAWGMEEGYDHGVSHPIYLLRKAIEPDPENPIYIQTIRRVGYRFIPNDVETCDKCEVSDN